jgi:predicted heme/steroid binding protein
VRQFTKKELALYDGQDGAPAYIAHGGRVYDASHSFFWRNGRHQVRYRAGADLTDALAQAPHGPDLLERLPVIGILIDTEEADPP